MSIDQGGLTESLGTGDQRREESTVPPGERTLVVITRASGYISETAALRDLAQRDIGVTVVLCSADGADATARLTTGLDDVGVRDHRILGGVGARMTDLTPRLYLPSGRSEQRMPDELAAADPAEIAADIATVIAITGARSVILWDSSGQSDGDVAVTATAARRAARVMAIPVFVRGANRAGRDDDARHPASIVIGSEEYLRDGDESTRMPFSWGDQSVGARIGAVLLAGALGIATGALGTVTQAWTIAVGSIDFPIGLIGGLVVTAALLTGLRLVFDTRAMVIAAAVGLLGIIALLSMESAGGSVLVPATAASYGWVYGPAVIALFVIAWPRLERDRRRSLASLSDESGQ